MKYKVYGVVAEESDPQSFEIPDNAEVVSAFYHPVDGKFTLVAVEKIPGVVTPAEDAEVEKVDETADDKTKVAPTTDAHEEEGEGKIEEEGTKKEGASHVE